MAFPCDVKNESDSSAVCGQVVLLQIETSDGTISVTGVWLLLPHARYKGLSEPTHPMQRPCSTSTSWKGLQVSKAPPGFQKE